MTDWTRIWLFCVDLVSSAKKVINALTIVSGKSKKIKLKVDVSIKKLKEFQEKDTFCLKIMKHLKESRKTKVEKDTMDP